MLGRTRILRPVGEILISSRARRADYPVEADRIGYVSL